MPLAPIHQPESATTQMAYGCGVGRTRVGGMCVARTTIRQTRPLMTGWHFHALGGRRFLKLDGNRERLRAQLLDNRAREFCDLFSSLLVKLKQQHLASVSGVSMLSCILAFSTRPSG
jgi:hypothetical protein